MVPSRSLKSPAGMRMQPAVTTVSLPPTASMTPKPVRFNPGSMPRMRVVSDTVLSGQKMKEYAILREMPWVRML